jgi:hypothetical protein
LGVIIAITFLVAGVAFGIVMSRNAVQETRNREALRQAASQVIGNNEVIGTVDALTSGRRGGGRVQYSFAAANGAMYSGEAQVPDDMFSGLLVSNPIAVRYLPADPNVNHPAGWEESDFSIWAKPFAPAIFVVSGLSTLLSMRGQRRLVAEGTPAVAVVTDCSSAKGRSGYFSLTYKFHTEDGTEIEGNGRYGSRLETGTKFVVLYLPQNPLRNAPYASAYYRAADSMSN